MKQYLQDSSSSYCVKERKPCVGWWVDKYFKDCLCNRSDEVSFGLGLVSLVAWGVAEIPQIVTNFRTKSSHGVSLLFLLTWVAGDIFNLLGCLLEPVTLPTQFYTALLYTSSTVILVLQTLYYDHVYRWWKGNEKRDHQHYYSNNHQDDEEETKKPLKPPKSNDSGIPIPGGTVRSHRRREFYYTSARSLAGSTTPPIGSHIRAVRSGPSYMEHDNGSSSEDETIEAPQKKTTTKPKPIPRSAGYGAFLATSMNLPPRTKAFMEVFIGFSGRKLLQENGASEKSGIGQLLGWLMAAIYMGGRIPQIWLNIKRGSVEGLNPLMFIFALIANIAYVGSIVVRTTEWEKIRANMAWLLDAVVCVALDLFIILQYIYYRYLRKRTREREEEEYGDYHEAAQKAQQFAS